MRKPDDVANRTQPWSDDDWWRLEVASFRGHRSVLMALARRMPRHVWRDVLEAQPGNRFADMLNGLCILVSLVVACVLAPLLAIRCLVIMVTGFAESPIAWQLGSVSFVAAASVFYPLFRARNEVHGRWERVVSIIVLVSTVIHLATGLIASRQESLDGSPLWRCAAVLAVMISAGNLMMAGPTRKNASRLPPEALVERLSPEEQARIRSELTHAIALLAERGAVSGDVAQRARQLPLGTLGSTLGSLRPETGEAREGGAIFNG